MLSPQPIAARLSSDGHSLTWPLPTSISNQKLENNPVEMHAVLRHIATGEKYHEGTLRFDRAHNQVRLHSSEAIAPHMVGDVTIGEHHLSLRQRRIRLEGLSNFRDLGGYVGTHHTMPWGRYYRSENLAAATYETWSTLVELGLTRIIDLRMPGERTHSPTQIPQDFATSVTIVEVPLHGRIKGFDDAIEAISEGNLSNVEDADMGAMYIDLLEHHIEDLRSIIEMLEDPASPVTLFHCTAGKDRTGLVAALLQHRAGVSTAEIVEDYALSNLYRTPLRLAQLREFFRSHGIEPRQVRPYLRAPVPALQSAFRWFEANSPEILIQPNHP